MKLSYSSGTPKEITWLISFRVCSISLHHHLFHPVAHMFRRFTMSLVNVSMWPSLCSTVGNGQQWSEMIERIPATIRILCMYLWHGIQDLEVPCIFYHSKQMKTAGFNKKDWWELCLKTSDPCTFPSLMSCGGGCMHLIHMKHVALNNLSAWYLRRELVKALVAKVGCFLE